MKYKDAHSHRLMYVGCGAYSGMQSLGGSLRWSTNDVCEWGWGLRVTPMTEEALCPLLMSESKFWVLDIFLLKPVP